MRFVPYTQLSSIANVIVDGAASEDTVLTLSHWPKSGTPTELKGDTSTESVFKYLDAPRFHVQADAVSNNHFDEDGLVGIFVLLEPSLAVQHCALLLDVAQAGDFGIFVKRDAARIAFTLSACADPDSSPLPPTLFTLPYPQMTAELYVRQLEILPKLLTGVNEYRALWESEDGQLTASETLLDRGAITIEERPALDLAVVRLPEDLSAERVHRFTQRRFAECHPYALHNRTPRNRLVLIRGHQVDFQYRYESWVQMVSRRPALRVDLAALAVELNEREQSKGRWIFEGVDRITPRLYLEGSPATSISPDLILQRLEEHLRVGVPAWDPYD